MVYDQAMQRGRPPAVVCLSGLDPSGGAGILADMEAIASMGCHTVPLITATTVQDTNGVRRVEAADPMLLIEQARVILEDIPVSAIKIGLLPDVRLVEVVHTLLTDCPQIPVILDPVLSSGAGHPLNTGDVRSAMATLLFPMTTVLTPNSLEARALAPAADNLDAAAHSLLDEGCEFVLITGTHEPGSKVVNTLYGNHRKLESFEWERLPHEYHGSGCTLASAVAGLLAHGHEPMSAIHEAQQYTWEALRQGYAIGRGQHIPNRLFWARESCA